MLLLRSAAKAHLVQKQELPVYERGAGMSEWVTFRNGRDDDERN